MTAPGILFTSSRPTRSGLSSRADVAMFAGCIARRPRAVPAFLKAALVEGGWSEKGLFKADDAQLDSLLNIPVPVESWSEFDRLFAWDRRPAAPGSGDMLPTALGLAVKSFFAEGGAKAYILRTGDPLPLVAPDMSPEDEAASKAQLLAWADASPPNDADQRVPLLPGMEQIGSPPDPTDPATWRGAAMIYAVDDCAMLCLPDLPDLCAGAPEAILPLGEVPGPPEQFRPCAPPVPELAPEPRAARPEYRAPRLDRAGYARWTEAIREALKMLGRPRGPAHRRDIMLVSALPLPRIGAEFTEGEARWPLAILDADGILAPGQRMLNGAQAGSARLQLGYPWIATGDSAVLPEGVQSPEGVLAGIIARTALAEGAFRSAAGRSCPSVQRTLPELATSDIARGLPGKATWLGERLCLIGEKRGSMELLSDTTMADDRNWRAGGVSRLMGIILRAARQFGEDLAFEPSGPALWARVRGTVESFLEELWRLGAFEGRDRREAFEVICGPDSMTQADIDNGRVICRIGFSAAYPIERITVSLLLLEAPSFGAREAA